MQYSPVLYSPSIEKAEADERDTAQELMETMRGIAEKTYEDTAKGLRSVHAKNHGVLKGKIEVFDNLPPELTQGIFAKPGSFDVIMRLSTSPGDLLPDSVSTSRGLGLKIIGVEGEKTPGTNGDVQNLVLVNAPSFLSPNAKAFLRNLKPLAATTDKAAGLKEALSAGLQKIEAVIESTGLKSGTITNMGGHPETHILGESFYSEVPYLYGPYMAKFSLIPSSPQLTSLTDMKIDMKDRPNALREAVRDYFNGNEAVWELCVQLCTDLEKMPIEDASVEWSEEKSPYIPVARITVPKSGMLDDKDAEIQEQALSFNPWHGLIAHRPLGSINRARRASYEMSANLRASRGCPMHKSA